VTCNLGRGKLRELRHPTLDVSAGRVVVTALKRIRKNEKEKDNVRRRK
jgi:hypothetical protein